MNEIELSAWLDDYRENAEKIHSVANQIKKINGRLGIGGVTIEQVEILNNNIITILNNWVDSAYVGKRKEKVLKRAYQAFFEALYEWLFCLKRIPDENIQRFVDEALFQGTLYRYLGYGDCKDNIEEQIEPKYDKYYVSWSKKEKNSYFESKLYGTITHITCELKNMHYGIDLNAFGVGRENEQEVLFPTIKDTITNIEYIERDCSEAE
ncbi:MAG: hypothetical protein HDR05_16525 [Lachnospiraceae bacterium]|nr:hypothetical protein [Lachnospiraceae bacterium]